VVICGLGDLGLRLAKTARKKGLLVVGIEKKEANSSLEQARKSGILVFEGDATDSSLLKKARAGSAKYVVACCAQDETNIAIASRLAGFMKTSKRNEPLVCRLLLNNDDLRKMLIDNFWKNVRNLPVNFQVNYRDLDYHRVVARKCLNDFPMDFKPVMHETIDKVHIVVIGFGKMGENILLQAARQGHFANTTGCYDKLKVTLMGRNVISRYHDFRNRYDMIDRICEVTCINSNNHNKAEILKNELVTFFFCFEKDNDSAADDHRNIEAGIHLLKNNTAREIQILVFQSTNTGLSALFPSEPEKDNTFPLLGSFGMIEDIFTWDLIIHDIQDDLAKNFHECYLETNGKGKKSKNRQESDKWENQSEDFQESNRQVADHLAVKLRAIGCQYRKRSMLLKSEKEIKEEDIDILSRMEHKRYCAERWIAGWKYGDKKSEEKKLNPSLVCWDELKDDVKKYDIDQVRAIIPTLRKFGYGVYKNGESEIQ